MHPDKIRPSSYLDNLGNDWLAVDANGQVVARAATEDGVRRASPDAAAFFAGKDLKGKTATAPKAPAPDGDMHGGPEDGLNKALEAEKKAADKEAADKEAAEKKGTAGTATGPTGTNAGSATTGAGANTAANTSGNAAGPAKDPLDHDNDGKKGGTASKADTSRQRKPAGK